MATAIDMTGIRGDYPLREGLAEAHHPINICSTGTRSTGILLLQKVSSVGGERKHLVTV